MISILPVDTSIRSELLMKISKLADEDDKILGNTALYTFSGDSLYVLLKDGVVLGFIQYYIKKTKPEITIHRICVKQDCRRSGYGKLLLQVLITECLSSSVQLIRLKCPVGIPANQFYQSTGFIFKGESLARTGRALNCWELEIHKQEEYVNDIHTENI